MRTFVGVVCVVLAILAIFRAGDQARWNIAHTFEGWLGYHPFDVLWPAGMAVLFVLAAITFLKPRPPKD